MTKIQQTSVATPPAFGAGKPHQLRTITWYERDDTENMMMVPYGIPVAAGLHAYYWKKRAQLGEVLDAKQLGGATGPHKFVLVADGGMVVASGSLDADEDVDSLAWIACFFMESYHVMFSLQFAPEHRTAAMKSHVFSMDDKLRLQVQP